MREQLLAKVVSLLQRQGFQVESFMHSNICFDLIARKENTVLVLKMFENVDALRKEQAAELRKLIKVFDATALVVGERTKAFALQQGVIYNRYGISVVNFRTLENFLAGKIPSTSYFKGKEIVSLDSEKLKEKRSRMGITFNELAKKLGTTVESLYRYEHGAKASLQMAKKLEDFFGTQLVNEIDLFEARENLGEELFSEKPGSEALEKIHSMGAKLAIFRHTPFSASTSPAEKLLISEGKTRADIRKKAIPLQKTRAILRSHSVIIADDAGKKSIANSAIIASEELNSFTKLRELLELIKEREKLR